MKFTLPTVSLEGKPAEVVATMGAATVSFIVTDTALAFTNVDDNDVEKENADYYRAAYAAVGGVLLWKYAKGKSGAMRSVLLGGSIGMLSASGSRLLKALKWTERITKFATPVRFRTSAQGGQGHTVSPRPATTAGYFGTGRVSGVPTVTMVRTAAAR